MTTLSTEYRQTRLAARKDPPRGLDGLVDGLIGLYRRRRSLVRRLAGEAGAILARTEALRCLPDAALREQVRDACRAYRRTPSDRDMLGRSALALIAEAAHRMLGLRPHKVQIMGALAIDQGFAAQLAPGEGKTLTVCLSAILAAWTQRPCHIVTANDYLAARDAELMRPLYEYCAVSVGHVVGAMTPPQRRDNYLRGVVYATSRELAADFLRDRMARGGICDPDRLLVRQLAGPATGERQAPVMGGLHTAIIDEADSVLIDEAVTPLIISVHGKNRMLRDASAMAARVVGALEAGIDYTVDERYRDIRFTVRGEERIAALTETLPPFWQSRTRREELLQQAIIARVFYHRDRHYIVRDDKIVIVDELTGRLMEGRTWSFGLHQAIEAKEGIAISEPTETRERLSFQRFFRLYHRLGGVSGTLQGIERELWRIYRLPVVRIPTRLPSRRKHQPVRLFADAAAKWDAVEAEVLGVHASGRPVLVGTRSISASESLAARLRTRGVACFVLNALHDAQEAEIVAVAGEQGRVTIATNMAGRGTDIKLGKGVEERGGLHVIATELHEARRVDWQLYGRCARQGEPGSVATLISLDDEIVCRFLGPLVRDPLRALCRLPAGHMVASGIYHGLQRFAERVAFAQRRTVLQTDSWLEDALSFTSGKMPS